MCSHGAFEHTSPVGTVAYEFVTDNSRVNETLEKYIDHIKNERKSKSLENLTNEEIEDIRKSFKILDKDRVYKKNNYNEANSIKFTIEGVGNLVPHNIFIDALNMIIIMLNDILRCIEINMNTYINLDENTINIKQNTKDEFTFTYLKHIIR